MKNKLTNILTFTFFTICFIVLFSVNAKAYIDPSVMTYAIQAIAGIVIAIGAFVGIYFRKAKRKINDKLGIDENKNKEVESDEVVVKTTKKKTSNDSKKKNVDSKKKSTNKNDVKSNNKSKKK